MYIQTFMLCSILIPILAGIILLLLPVGKVKEKTVSCAAIAALVLTVAVVAALLVSYSRQGAGTLTLFSLTEGLSMTFSLDYLGAFFMGFISFIWLLGGIFSLEYLHHEHHKKRFWGF